MWKASHGADKLWTTSQAPIRYTLLSFMAVPGGSRGLQGFTIDPLQVDTGNENCRRPLIQFPWPLFCSSDVLGCRTPAFANHSARDLVSLTFPPCQLAYPHLQSKNTKPSPPAQLPPIPKQSYAEPPCIILRTLHPHYPRKARSQPLTGTIEASAASSSESVSARPLQRAWEASQFRNQQNLRCRASYQSLILRETTLHSSCEVLARHNRKPSSNPLGPLHCRLGLSSPSSCNKTPSTPPNPSPRSTQVYHKLNPKILNSKPETNKPHQLLTHPPSTSRLRPSWPSINGQAAPRSSGRSQAASVGPGSKAEVFRSWGAIKDRSLRPRD